MNEYESRQEARFRRRAERMHYRYGSRNGRLWTGAFLFLIGAAFLLRNLSPAFFTPWLLSWPMLLIVMGLVMGIRHRFRHGAGIVLIFIGSFFLLEKFSPAFAIDRAYIWPIGLMLAGLFLVLRPRHHRWGGPEDGDRHDDSHPTTPTYQGPAGPEDDYLDTTSVFGGVKKTVFSKDFRGGDVVNFLGGTELNLTQADIQGRVTLDVTQVFGGTKLIVPPHWDIKPEMAAVFGGIDDKRPVQQVVIDPGKVLVLKGTTFFGGLEIRSY